MFDYASDKVRIFRKPVEWEGLSFRIVQVSYPNGVISERVHGNTSDAMKALQEDEDLEEYLCKAYRHLLPSNPWGTN